MSWCQWLWVELRQKNTFWCKEYSNILLCDLDAFHVIVMFRAVSSCCLPPRCLLLRTACCPFVLFFTIFPIPPCKLLPLLRTLLQLRVFVCFQWEAKANCGQISSLATFGPNLPFRTSYTEGATGRRYKRESPRSASCSVTFLSKQCKYKDD